MTDAPETRALLAAGRLEQTCRNCGRWEAAGRTCSWCQRPTGPADWYLNDDFAERHGRRPAVAPADPPDEFRRVASWPPEWGECPYQKAASPRYTPPKPGTDAEIRVPAAPGTLGLL